MNAQVRPKPVERQELCNALRFLAIDAVQAANSGHPGMPLGMADIAEVLWREHLKHNPADPLWPDRDRFVLSNGHGSMLLYALLHLTGYALPLEELKRFRQLHSKTPGHPEVGVTPGVETTTGPLGQGLANAVGMALAEALLAREFNRPGHTIVDHRTYVFAGDGCLMEGISHEAASLPGTRHVHGAPLGADEVANTRRALGWPYPPFVVPEEARSQWDARARGEAAEADWRRRFEAYRSHYPHEAAEFERRTQGRLPAHW